MPNILTCTSKSVSYRKAKYYIATLVFQFQAGRKCTNQTWNKSIEICSLNDGKVVQVSEHPLTLDESKANVSYIQEKLSQEAFGGEKVKLLNAKVADAEGTRGTCKSFPSLSPLSLSLFLFLFLSLSLSLLGIFTVFFLYFLLCPNFRLQILANNQNY